MKRREVLHLSLALAGAARLASAQTPQNCPADGTPAQFVPKKPADSNPQADEFAKYPSCPYCGMDRKQNHSSRMLIQYSDNLPDGTCSIHCAAISLSINIDREPKAIWAADNASSSELKPLVNVDQATFLIGSKLRGVMTSRSKVAFGSADAAKAAQAANGGEPGNFDQALLAAYTDMAKDVSMIRGNRQRRRSMEQKG